MYTILNIFSFFILALVTYSSKLNLKSTLELSQCWVYANSADEYLNSVSLNNTVTYVNKQTQINKTLIYSKKEGDCLYACERNRYSKGCYSTYSYDVKFGIPIGNYVCWLYVPCPRHFNEKEYDQIDISIKNKSKYRCSFLCDSIYGQEGRCLQRKIPSEDQNYYCFFRATSLKKNTSNKAVLNSLESLNKNKSVTSKTK